MKDKTKPHFFHEFVEQLKYVGTGLEINNNSAAVSSSLCFSDQFPYIIVLCDILHLDF